MFDQQFLFNMFSLASILIAGGTLFWQMRRSHKDDKHQQDTFTVQERSAKALEEQNETWKLHATILQKGLIKDEPPPQGETAEQRWTRAFVLGQVANVTIALQEEFQGEFASVHTMLTALKARVDDIVTLRDYMDHEANLFKTRDEATQVRDEAAQIREEMREYQRRGFNTDAIQRQILLHIGYELVRLAGGSIPASPTSAPWADSPITPPPITPPPAADDSNSPVT